MFDRACAFARNGRNGPTVKRTKWVWVVAGAFGPACVAACSAGGVIDWDAGGSDATTTDAPSKNDATFLGDASTSDVVLPPDDAGVDAPDPDLACLTDDAGCENCCFNNHVDGGNTYFGALLGCACATGATCHSVANCYGNLCKGNAETPACDKCLSNPDAGDCYNKADTACAGDPDCVALFDCLGNVCAPPPDDAGTE